MHTDSPNSPLVAVKRNIIIKAPQAAVFTFAADLRNDARWRQEVHSTVLDAAAPAPGVVATEDAFLSAKRPHSLTQLVYEAYEPAQLMRCQTPADSPRWMRAAPSLATSCNSSRSWCAKPWVLPRRCGSCAGTAAG